MITFNVVFTPGTPARLLPFGRLRVLEDGTPVGMTYLNRAIPELHHVGGFSGPDFWGLPAMLRSMRWFGRSKDERRPGHIVDHVAFRPYLIGRQRAPRFQRLNERRSAVRAHVPAVLDAMLAGEPLPPTLRTDSVEVDRRVAALVAAIQTHYRPLEHRA